MQPTAEERDHLNPKLTRSGAWIAALVLFAVALGIRLAGIGWGLPNEQRHQSLHPDENLIYAVSVYTSYFQPGFYNYGTAYLTAVHLANDVGSTYGAIPNAEDAEQWQVVRGGISAGRFVSAASGAVTVALVFATLLLITGSFGAFVGAIALLIAPGHVVHSRFVTTDVFFAMTIALAAYLLLRAILAEEKPNTRQILWIGAAIGIAAGTKYSGALLLLPAAYALWNKQADIKSAGLGVLAFAGGFLIATPGLLLESSAFFRDFFFEVRHSAEGHGLVFVDTPHGFVYHAINLTEAFGFAPLCLGVAGIVWALWSRKPWAIAIAIFVVAYYAVIGLAEVKFLRYVLPLLPFVAVGIGYLAGRAHEEKGRKRLVSGATILLIGLTAATTGGAFSLTRLMAIEDPRDQAAQWLQVEAEDKTIGFVSDPWFYSPPLSPDFGLLAPSQRLEALLANPQLIRMDAESPTRTDWDVRLLDVRPEYIVFSSFEFADHDRLNDPNFVEFMERFENEYDFVGLFWGPDPAFPTSEDSTTFTREGLRILIRQRYPQTHDMMYISPTICIFRAKPEG